MKRQEITLKGMLEDYLLHEVDILMMCSKGEAGIEPKKEFEEEFDEQQEKCRILRELIRAIQNENVKHALQEWRSMDLKDWQKKVMNGKGLTTDDISREEEHKK